MKKVLIGLLLIMALVMTISPITLAVDEEHPLPTNYENVA